MINKYILDVFLIHGLETATLGFMEFLQNNNHPAVKKMEGINWMIVVLQKNSIKPRVAVYIPWIKYIYKSNIYLFIIII